MPYDTYRMYQVERAKSPGEIQRSAEAESRSLKEEFQITPP